MLKKTSQQFAMKRLLLCASLCIVVSACGDSAPNSAGSTPEDAGQNKAIDAGQIVATVNGEEVTIFELNNELSRINIPADANRQTIEENVLRALVHRKALEQKAISDGLDRSPGVIGEIRRSRSTILAQAYIRSKIASAPTVSRQEAEEFIIENPQIFANRTYYIFDAIMVPTAALDDAKKDKFEEVGNLGEIERTLTSESIPNQRKPYTAFSETIPSAMRDKLPELMRDRTVFFVVQGARTMITQFQESRPAALTGEDAYRAASNTLRASKNRQLAAEIQQTAIDTANVTFQGKYASMTKNPPNLVEGSLQNEIDKSVHQPVEESTGSNESDSSNPAIP